MASAGTTPASGCIVVVAALLLLLPLLIAAWPVLVLLVVGVGAVALVAGLVEGERLRRLRGIAAMAQRRYADNVFRFGDHYGVIRAIGVSSGGHGQGRLEVQSLELIVEEQGVELRRHTHRLTPPADLSKLAGNSAIGRFLSGQGISEVNDLAVEAKATLAAIEGLREITWTTEAIGRLQPLIDSTRQTLRKAPGNELLEPSIPQLQEALQTFRAEEQKLQRARDEAREMTRKLVDFLGVPAAIRPILSFDLEPLVDPQRLASLQQSFEEVVLLNDAFRELSATKLA